MLICKYVLKYLKNTLKTVHQSRHLACPYKVPMYLHVSRQAVDKRIDITPALYYTYIMTLICLYEHSAKLRAMLIILSTAWYVKLVQCVHTYLPTYTYFPRASF